MLADSKKIAGGCYQSMTDAFAAMRMVTIIILSVFTWASIAVHLLLSVFLGSLLLSHYMLTRLIRVVYEDFGLIKSVRFQSPTRRRSTVGLC